MAGSNKALGALAAFLSVAEIAFAITIIVLVADQLWPGAGSYYGCYWDYSQSPAQQYCGTWTSSGVCLMTDNSVNVCRYSYAAAAIGIVAAIITVFAMCLPPVATLLAGLFGSIWWLAYAITATAYSKDVNNQEFSVTLAGQTVTIPWGYPRGNYRTMVYALAWTTFCCCMVVMALAFAMMKGKGKEEGESYANKNGHIEDPVKPAGNPPATAAV
ncbi:peroxin 13 [Chlorella sorokiniana]|jgi:hypothetical protein|uniref:Peroxin 13 n=1 Tax=Chlorella sorokiniana TaxID=3076 RepID=A0A2P6TUN6_CHLSO|nr:peroxin 13 [Chlorella sorokiniana]|eukprot:PRW57746.1 peroxin 13 [Chlorella sorokiniana]